MLKMSTYVSGTKKTIADVTLYYAVHEIMVSKSTNSLVMLAFNKCLILSFFLLQQRLSPQEKAEHVHVSRWFDNMQQDDKLRQTMDLINFNMMHLYL